MNVRSLVNAPPSATLKIVHSQQRRHVMYMRLITLCVLIILAGSALGQPTLFCKEPKNDYPTGVQDAVKSTVTTWNAVSLSNEDLEKNINVISSVGSGVILDTRGHILTSGHGVAKYLRMKDRPKKHRVYLYDCREYEARVVAIGGDEKEGIDAVILKITGPPPDLIPIKRDYVSFPDKNVYAVGSPYGWMNTVAAGVLAGPYLNRNLQEVYAHVDLKEGMSGGPLVTEDGILVGTAQGKKLLSFGGAELYVSFFVPVARINSFVEKQILSP